MHAWIRRLLAVVAATAVGRGIVFAFALDQKMAAAIKVSLGWAMTHEAAAWIISGLIGLAALGVWLFGERRGWFKTPEPQPKRSGIGVHIAGSENTKLTDVEVESKDIGIKVEGSKGTHIKGARVRDARIGLFIGSGDVHKKPKD